MSIKKLLTVPLMVAFILLAGCRKNDFTEIPGVCPIVVSTIPTTGALNVPLNQVISITFNDEMDPATITAASILLSDGAPVLGTISYSGLTATFVPTEPLDDNTTYTGRVKTTVKNLTGNFLQEDYVWTFSTGSELLPIVISTVPINNATNIGLNTPISATFNQAMNPVNMNTTTFTLYQGSNQINGAVSYNGLTASFVPDANLAQNTLYTATITTGATSMLGTALATNYVWNFTTGTNLLPIVISTNPINNETNVPQNQSVTATFNQAMNPLNMNGSTFTLYNGASQITGVVSYTGLTATFNPTGDLQANTTYTATITVGATSLLGDALSNNYVWTFTTIDAKVPPVIDLGDVALYGIISGVAVSNNAGASEIHDMNIGIYPGFRSSITGFFDVDGGPGLIFNGEFFAADDPNPVPALLLQAKNDLTAAYLQAEGAISPAPVFVAGDIGGQTLAPGIYKSTSTLLIQNGNLTLDAQGDPNAYWIFQIASDFTTIGGAPYPSPAGGNVILAGGAQAKNIFWQVGSSATIGDYTSFKGNILALTSVTMNAYAQAVGRMLCSNGAVTLTSTNFIFKP
jgi:hypothetical protein